MAHEHIVIRGAREHNLKDVTVSLPRERLVVITGLSGSGKSSLAFDTLYAEGQRRYVESLSAYARQFLGQMDKPDVDSIEGLSPAISIDQKTTARNPRSTVGTVTETYDYLRLLYARVGHPHCPKCGREITGQSAEQIVDQVLLLPEGTRFTIDAPVVRTRKGEFRDLFEQLRSDGYTRVKIDGEQLLLEEPIDLDKQVRHSISVVVDRLVMKQGLRTRLTDSVETALRLAEGLVEVAVVDGTTMTYSERFACPEDGISLPELAPRIFSFNSPHGACPRCTGLGTQREIDPELVVPDPSLSISQGALVPWTVINSNFYTQVINAIADRYEVDLDTPWADLPEEHRDLFLKGTGGDKLYVTYRNRMNRKRSYMLAFEGIVPSLERRYRETDSAHQKERIEEYMALKPCPACHGDRLKETSLAVTVGGLNIAGVTRMSVTAAIEFVDGLELTETERTIGARILKEIRERLTFLADVGVGYLTLGRAAASLSGGEAQRIRLATQIGSSLMGVLYILDEPSIGLHQRDNAKLLATLERLRELGNTVIVVEHDEETIRAADHIIDMGPGAGEHGGRVVAAGTAEQVMASERSITGAYLSGRRCIPVPDRRMHDAGWFGVQGAAEHNLKAIDVDLPVSKLICVTGVSGSGKSTLVNDVIFKALANRLNRARVKPGAHRAVHGIEVFDKVIDIDQSPIGRTPRSNPATYTGLFDHIRALYATSPDARARGTSRAGSRSTSRAVAARRAAATARSRSRCTSCPTSTSTARSVTAAATTARRSRSSSRASRSPTCSTCRSRRRSSSSSRSPSCGGGCRRCTTSGSTTCGWGSRRRRSRAARRSGSSSPPSSARSRPGGRSTSSTSPPPGLHTYDIEKLLEVLQRLVDAGNTVLVIEHNLDVIKQADWVLDLGPEGGDAGGEVVAQGTPEEVAETPGSHTGEFLRRVLPVYETERALAG